MKVLFVHDSASTCHDIAPYLGIDYEFLNLQPTLQMARKIRKNNADIIHANYIRSPAYACLLSLKSNYVLEAHGDDVRNGVNLLQSISMKRAREIFYSTPDLATKVKGTLLPQPVDVEKFSPRPIKKGKAIYFLQITSSSPLRAREPEYIAECKSYCQKQGLDFVLKEKWDIPHDEMPDFLSQFELLFDKEYPGKLFPGVYSKLALESMALGLRVMPDTIPFEAQQKSVLENHDSRKVAKFLLSEYEKILSR